MLDPLRHTTARRHRAKTAQVPAPSGTLVHARDLTYLGSFRVPQGDLGGPQFHGIAYSQGTIAYNPNNDSLFIVGHVQDQGICEITIPSNPSTSATLSDLPRATALQNLRFPLASVPNDTLAGRTTQIGGALVLPNNTLMLAVYDYYDGGGSAVGSHLILDSPTLATANVNGYYSVGADNPGHVAKFMCPVPSAWQTTLASKYLTGSSGLAVVGRTSSGPAAFGFDPADFGPSTLAGTGHTTAVKMLDYPLTNPLGPGEGPPVSPLYGTCTGINGVLFVPNTNSVLYFGYTATNYVAYGKGIYLGDLNNTGKGPHSINGELALQVWAYDVNDLLLVKNGTKLSYEIVPYGAWNFNPPFFQYGISGSAYDPATGRVFVTFSGAEQPDVLPVVGVYSIAPPATSAAGPVIGAVCVTDTVQHQINDVDEPFKEAPYFDPLTAGHDVTLTASNVYPITAGAAVTGVSFSVGGVAAGAGTQGGGYFSHQWTLNYVTTGKTTGNYAVVATATDSGGRTGTKSGTLKIA